MKISSLYDTELGPWKRQLSSLLQFARLYGEQRIPKESLKTLARLTPDQLSIPGVSLLVASVRGQQGRELSGISFVSGYGKETCLLAVHPLYRNKHTGSALLTEQLARLGRLECRVDAEHTAGLKMCFNAGLAAVAFVNGATEKPTLLLRSPESIGHSSSLPMQEDVFITDFKTTQEGDLLCRNQF